MPEPKKKTVKCPECETETELIRDEDGDWNGRCPNDECRLDVGACYDRARHADASERLREQRKEARKQTGKEKKDRFSF